MNTYSPDLYPQIVMDYEYEKDFDYDQSAWDGDDILTVLNENVKEQFSPETQRLLNTF